MNWVVDFLRNRQQRVKLSGVFSDWLDVPAGVPQGTRLGPWLFLAMINDLRLPEEFLMWKFADDATVSEVVPASKLSTLQQAADYIHDWSQENHLQLILGSARRSVRALSALPLVSLGCPSKGSILKRSP